jgi:hypothetical protein
MSETIGHEPKEEYITRIRFTLPVQRAATLTIFILTRPYFNVIIKRPYRYMENMPPHLFLQYFTYR